MWLTTVPRIMESVGEIINQPVPGSSRKVRSWNTDILTAAPAPGMVHLF